MKNTTKTLTKDCPKCTEFHDPENKLCKWGNSTKKKHLVPPKGKKKKWCKLILSDERLRAT